MFDQILGKHLKNGDSNSVSTYVGDMNGASIGVNSRVQIGTGIDNYIVLFGCLKSEK